MGKKKFNETGHFKKLEREWEARLSKHGLGLDDEYVLRPEIIKRDDNVSQDAIEIYGKILNEFELQHETYELIISLFADGKILKEIVKKAKMSDRAVRYVLEWALEEYLDPTHEYQTNVKKYRVLGKRKEEF